MRVRTIDLASVHTIFLLDFGIVPTVLYCMFFILSDIVLPVSSNMKVWHNIPIYHLDL